MIHKLRLFFGLVAALFALSLCSCSSDNEQPAVRTGSYVVAAAQIPKIDNYESTLRGVLYNGESYCVQVRYDDDIRHFGKLYYYNRSGELINTLDTNSVAFFITAGNIVFYVGVELL